jgi:hypothetical protein
MYKDLTNEELHERIKRVKKLIKTCHNTLNNLIHECGERGHVFVKRHDSIICKICGFDCGWWCPESPNHICNYEHEDGCYDEDSCKYCGEPLERK